MFKREILYIFISIFFILDLSAKEKTMQFGKFKKIYPDDVKEFIDQNKDEKPTIVYLSSIDGGCGPCIAFNYTIYKIAKDNQDKFNFLFVDFFPWTKINDYKQLLKRYNMTGVPFTLVVYKNKIITYFSGNYKYSAAKKNILKAYDEIKQNKNMNRFGNHIENGSVFHINCAPYLINHHNKFLKKDHYKAAALLRYTNKQGADRLGFYTIVGYLSQEEANKAAMAKCEKKNKKYKFSGECKLYMMANMYVYDKSESEIERIIKKMPPQKTSLDKHLKKFESQKDYKAFALAKREDGYWHVWWVYGYKTQQKADEAVYKKCQEGKKKYKINSECKIIKRGNSKSQNPISNTVKSISINKLHGYKITAGNLNSKDNPIYKVKYESLEFGCNNDAVFESASDSYDFHKRYNGRFIVSKDNIEFIYNDDEDTSNYIVNLQNAHIIVGKSNFEGKNGLVIKSIKKIKRCD